MKFYIEKRESCKNLYAQIGNFNLRIRLYPTREKYREYLLLEYF